MNKIVLLLMATMLPLMLVGSAFAQDSIDVPIEISQSELVVVIIGALGVFMGLVLGVLPNIIKRSRQNLD